MFSLFVGLATVGVGVLAWLTSRRAARIAEEATRIAEQQHVDSTRLRRETARIIGRLLVAEMGTIPPRAARVARAMARARRHTEGDVTLLLASYYDAAIYEARQDFMPTAEHVLDRIHTLPDTLGADLATLIASCRALKAMAARVEDKASRRTLFDLNVATDYVSISDGLGDWLTLEDQAIWILRVGAQFSNNFRAYVGVAPIDYSPNLREFSEHGIVRGQAATPNP
ncbi:hypothetical protein [Xanthomonas arboricola]|uniref:hypothetical protein n=1 Tax=Xanthomonas arboricola TaxID=56448 RepID=UPI001186CA8D|nr:hypothetical protein [Xanthomonas arboricola]